ncbi:ATP-binding protein [Trinickia terrae]|uniref:ATP-binding protein n=1 Tax=Trinickia terrae TaxID=2571161 RepID=UPI001980A0AD|nr:ATP-binding protein [Trinickia terrae]
MSEAIEPADLTAANWWDRLNAENATHSQGAADTARRAVERDVQLPSAALQRAPRTVAETGLDMSMLVELIAKVAFARGTVELAQLVDTLKLPIPVIEEVTVFMIRNRLLEITRRGGAGFDVHYQLTEEGRDRARVYIEKCAYVGPAPVSLADYNAAIAAQSVELVRVSRAYAHAAFEDLTISADLVDEVGGSMNTGRPLLLYGPAGGGKTYLAENLARLLPGTISVPYAIAVEREIVQIFDSLVHVPVETPRHMTSEIQPDRRWQRCRRPVVKVGGELMLDMLELRYDRTTGFYQAPSHVKANNGLFIVDDLGRQRVSPQELLNRWITPLGRGSDTLTLNSGMRFTLPFDVRLAFSSNFTPSELGDEAFLRRLGAKLYIGALAEHDYRAMYERLCRELKVASDDEAFGYLLNHLHYPARRALLACYPRDLLSLVVAHALYREEPAKASPETLRRAWLSYFANTSGLGASPVIQNPSTESAQRELGADPA